MEKPIIKFFVVDTSTKQQIEFPTLRKAKTYIKAFEKGFGECSYNIFRVTIKKVEL